MIGEDDDAFVMGLMGLKLISPITSKLSSFRNIRRENSDNGLGVRKLEFLKSSSEL